MHRLRGAAPALHRPRPPHLMRLSQMATHLRPPPPAAGPDPASAAGGAPPRPPLAPSLSALPKTAAFAARLPADPLLPTAALSHRAPRGDLFPRPVRGALYTFVRPTPAPGPLELLAVSPRALRDLGLDPRAAEGEEFVQALGGGRILGWEGVPDGGEALDGSSTLSVESLSVDPEAASANGDGAPSSDDAPSAPYPWAQNYGGFQFGQWAGQLGDGRAVSLFETRPAGGDGTRYELQLKGAGMTPYSRFADGRAVLRSSIREFLVSEHLNALGVPTTRALALVLASKLGVMRERGREPGAIVARFTPSWIRIGTFDLLRARGDRENLRRLATYVAEEVYGGWEALPGPLPEVPFDPSNASTADEPLARVPAAALLSPPTGLPAARTTGAGDRAQNRFARLYRAIARANAATVARWQVFGFANGVLNTDNTSVSGLSLDFGPFGFLDAYDPAYTPNHDDHSLRYAYRAQPGVVWWNLVRLAEALAELIGAGDGVDGERLVREGPREEDVEEMQPRAQTVVEAAGHEYRALLALHFRRGMAARLGVRARDDDAKDGEAVDELVSEWLVALGAGALDFHLSFRRLGRVRTADLDGAEACEKAADVFFRREDGSAVEEPAGGAGGAREKMAAWLPRWRERVEADWGAEADGARVRAMEAVNPKVRTPLILAEIMLMLIVPKSSCCGIGSWRRLSSGSRRRASGRFCSACWPWRSSRSARSGVGTARRRSGSAETCPSTRLGCNAVVVRETRFAEISNETGNMQFRLVRTCIATTREQAEHPAPERDIIASAHRPLISSDRPCRHESRGKATPHPTINACATMI